MRVITRWYLYFSLSSLLGRFQPVVLEMSFWKNEVGVVPHGSNAKVIPSDTTCLSNERVEMAVKRRMIWLTLIDYSREQWGFQPRILMKLVTPWFLCLENLCSCFLIFLADPFVFPIPHNWIQRIQLYSAFFDRISTKNHQPFLNGGWVKTINMPKCCFPFKSHGYSIDIWLFTSNQLFFVSHVFHWHGSSHP